MYAAAGVAAGVEVGAFWSKDVQLDVAAVRDDGCTDVGECNWGRVRSVRKLADELDAKVRYYPNARNATIGRWLFVRRLPKSINGPRPAEHCIDLEALYRG